MENNVTARGPQFRHKGFGHWIIGYQNFLEPIIRASLALQLADEGFSPSASRTVGRVDLDSAACAVANDMGTGKLNHDERGAFAAELRRRSRLQLDIAFSGPGSTIIGEIKSWGGWSIFDLNAARAMTFAGRDALLFLLDRVNGEPVERILFVVWGSKVDCHGEVVAMLEERFGRKVQLEYADDLLSSFTPVLEIGDQLKRLEETAQDVRTWLGGLTVGSGSGLGTMNKPRELWIDYAPGTKEFEEYGRVSRNTPKKNETPADPKAIQELKDSFANLGEWQNKLRTPLAKPKSAELCLGRKNTSNVNWESAMSRNDLDKVLSSLVPGGEKPTSTIPPEFSESPKVPGHMDPKHPGIFLCDDGRRLLGDPNTSPPYNKRNRFTTYAGDMQVVSLADERTPNVKQTK